MGSEDGSDEEWDGTVAAAGGACTESAECADGEFCIFSFNPDDETFAPSVCGTEADCTVEVEDDSGYEPFCLEFEGEEDEDSALRLWSAGAAAVAAVFMSM